MVDEALASQDSIVLFIDEVHAIVGAGQGGNEGGLDIANVFKPAMRARRTQSDRRDNALRIPEAH